MTKLNYNEIYNYAPEWLNLETILKDLDGENLSTKTFDDIRKFLRLPEDLFGIAHNLKNKNIDWEFTIAAHLYQIAMLVRSIIFYYHHRKLPLKKLNDLISYLKLDRIDPKTGIVYFGPKEDISFFGVLKNVFFRKKIYTQYYLIPEVNFNSNLCLDKLLLDNQELSISLGITYTMLGYDKLMTLDTFITKADEILRKRYH